MSVVYYTALEWRHLSSWQPHALPTRQTGRIRTRTLIDCPKKRKFLLLSVRIKNLPTNQIDTCYVTEMERSDRGRLSLPDDRLCWDVFRFVWRLTPPVAAVVLLLRSQTSFVTESVWWSLSRWTNKVGAGRVANRLLDGDLLDAIVKCDKSWDILDIIGCCADGGAAFRQGLLMIVTYYRVEFLKETNILLSEIDIVIVFYGKREVQNCFRVLQSCSKWNLCITRGEIKMQRQKLGFLWSKIRENGNVENVSKIIKLSRRINRRDEDAF